MKTYLALLAALFSCALCRAQSIEVAYPSEGYQMSSVPQTFIFGKVTPPDGVLSINSTAVKVSQTGAFIAFLPVQDGDFQFRLDYSGAFGKISAVRNVKIGDGPKVVFGEDPKFDENSVSPSLPMELRAGDNIVVSVRGTPSLKTEFAISGVRSGIPMIETPAASGNYSGVYTIGPDDKADNAEITVKMKKGWSSAKVAAKGRLTILREAPRVVEVTADTVPVRSDYGTGYTMFLRQGTRLLTSGKIGPRTRIAFSDTENGWVDSDKLRMLPEGTVPPRSVIGTIKVAANHKSTFVRIASSKLVPYSVDFDGDSMLFTMYYSKSHTSWVIYDSSDTFIKDISWRQQSKDACTIRINLAEGKKLWGYNVTYSDGNINIEMRHPPVLAASNPDRPLEGLTVVLDAGHSPKRTPPYDGAIGPSGTFEYDIVMKTVFEAEPILQNLGARVVLTRRGDEDTPLTSRPNKAWENRGDIFVSVHNNALPDGADPLAPSRGFSTYYYQPFSRELAKHVHETYARNTTIPDEGLRFGDYLVVRQTEMPSMLLECAYLILPEQEALLSSQPYRHKIAVSISDGIMAFLRSEKILPPPPQKIEAKAVRKSAKMKKGDSVDMEKNLKKKSRPMPVKSTKPGKKAKVVAESDSQDDPLS